MSLEQKFEKYNCYQCHDSGDMNCTARCSGSQVALKAYLEKEKNTKETGYELRKKEYERQEEFGEYAPPSEEAVNFVSRLKNALGRKKE